MTDFKQVSSVIDSSLMTKTKDRVKDHGEVLTPPQLVSDMLDLAWTDDIHVTYLEPSCGTGNFLVEILRRKLDISSTVSDAIISLTTLYGFDILLDNVETTKDRLREMMWLWIDWKFPDFNNNTYNAIGHILSYNIQVADMLNEVYLDGSDIYVYEWKVNKKSVSGKQVMYKDVSLPIHAKSKDIVRIRYI